MTTGLLFRRSTSSWLVTPVNLATVAVLFFPWPEMFSIDQPAARSDFLIDEDDEYVDKMHDSLDILFN